MRPSPFRLAILLALSAFLTGLPSRAAVPAETLDIADDALRDTFTLQGLSAMQPRLATGGYDWEWRGPRDDPEWAWFFNRHGWFPELALAARSTGDPRYAAALVATLDDWIAAHPAPGRITFSAAWRPLEAARRITDSWLPALAELRGSPALTPAFLARYRACLVAHGEHLRHHHAFGGNHLVTEMLALVHLALAEPSPPGAATSLGTPSSSSAPSSLSGSADWLAYGLDQLDRAFADQIYPDGAHKELSTHYQRVVALNYTRLVDLLASHNHPALADAWRPRVDKLWRYVAAVRQPDGTNPLTNDSDREDYSALLARYAPDLVDLPTVPTHFPWAGQTVFRAGEQWAFFDAGPRGTDHDHADRLHLSLTLGRKPFLVDNGRYTYAPGPWRDYFAGPAGHNVLLLDGQGTVPAPRAVSAPPSPAHFLRAGSFALAWGDATFATADNARSGEWRRIVVHAESAGWVVIDRVIAFGSPELQTLWHWAPAVNLTLPSPPDVRLIARSSTASLALTLSRPALVPGTWRQLRGVEPPAAVQGWFSAAFNFREPAPCAVYTQRLQGPVTNAWVFQPADKPLLTAITLPDGDVLITPRNGTTLQLRIESPEGAQIR